MLNENHLFRLRSKGGLSSDVNADHCLESSGHIHDGMNTKTREQHGLSMQGDEGEIYDCAMFLMGVDKD